MLLLFLPVLEVSGSSMEPTLRDGDILLLQRPGTIESGEMCGIYAQGRLILKRVIGLPGDVVTMDETGAVYVNDERLREPYISEQAVGTCDLVFPFTVPEGSTATLALNCKGKLTRARRVRVRSNFFHFFPPRSGSRSLHRQKPAEVV